MTVRSTRSQVHGNDMTLLIIRNQHFTFLPFYPVVQFFLFCYYYLLSLSFPLFLSVIIFLHLLYHIYMDAYRNYYVYTERTRLYCNFIFVKAYITSLLFSLLIRLFLYVYKLLRNNLKNSGNVVFTYILSMK